MILNLDFEQLDNLSKIDYEFLNYINSNPLEVINTTITDLSKKVFLSTTSIVRFCKKIGFESYSQFKFELKQRYEELQTVETDESDPQEVFRDTMLNTMNMISNDSIEEIANLFINNNILLYGKGTNASLLEYFSTQLNILGCITIMNKDDHVSSLYLENMSKNTICIILSLTGETKSSIDVSKAARANGVKVVSFTKIGKNTLSENSDISIFFDSHGERMKISPKLPIIDMGTRFQILYIFDLILRKIADLRTE